MWGGRLHALPPPPRSHRRTRWGGWAAPPPGIFQIAIFGQKKKSCNIWAKPFDFRASNGENIRATDLSPPKRNVRLCP